MARWLGGWLERRPVHQKVSGLISGQVTNPGFGFDPPPALGARLGGSQLMFLSRSKTNNNKQ